MAQPHFLTSDTPLAAFLIQSGFTSLPIQYEVKANGKKQATMPFASTPELQAAVNLYNSGDATANIARYEHAKNSLLDRIMGGLP